MVKQLKVCEVCGKEKKNLPQHMLFAHSEPVGELVPNEPAELPLPPLEEVIKELDNTDTKGFDFGELNTCQQCHAEYPSKLMEFHMHVRHGM